MGMDVFGKAPRSETGKYFRRNIRNWHPLARFILDNAPDNLTDKCKYWHSNDGDGLNDEDSKKLAEFLEAFDESKIVDEEDSKRLKQSVKDFTAFLKDCGGFEIF